jgi:hypothetical protein
LTFIGDDLAQFDMLMKAAMVVIFGLTLYRLASGPTRPPA